VSERFGSWPAALEAAGLTPYVRHWSDEQILAGLRGLAEELGRAPTQADLDPRPQLFARPLPAVRFGSWERALQAAGLVPARHAWTRADVIESFQRFEREHGRLPSEADLRCTRGTGYPPASAVRARFGSLHEALRACGYDGPARRTRFEADDAVRALRAFGDTHGRAPTAREWDALGRRPSAPPIIRHFGAWNAALAVAGLTVTRPTQRWSDEQILAAIRGFEAEHGRAPATADFGGGTLPGFETVRTRYGSLAAVLERARAPRPR
jgi:hypothetical protein